MGITYSFVSRSRTDCGNSSVVERNLAKVDVASSTLVSRSTAQAVTSSLCCMPCHHFPPMMRHFFVYSITIIPITISNFIQKDKISCVELLHSNEIYDAVESSI